MTWTATYNQSLQIVEIVYTGRTNSSDLQEGTSRSILLGKENNTTLFLVDATELKLTASLIDIYNLPDKQYLSEGVDRVSRIAVIRPRSPRSQEAAQFYETVCHNRGWTAKVVATRDEALDWLLDRIPTRRSD